MIQESFLPSLLFGKKKTLSPIVGIINAMPINMAELGLLNPEKKKYLSSQQGSKELIRAETEGGGSLTPVTNRRSGKKGVTVRKTSKSQMKPNSRVYFDTSKVCTGA